jgi:hypothetical protein
MMGKPERKRRLRRPGRRWVFKITMDSRGTEWDSACWIDVAQKRDKRGATGSKATDRRVAWDVSCG